jgi:hypothetical protein
MFALEYQEKHWPSLLSGRLSSDKQAAKSIAARAIANGWN